MENDNTKNNNSENDSLENDNLENDMLNYNAINDSHNAYTFYRILKSSLHNLHKNYDMTEEQIERQKLALFELELNHKKYEEDKRQSYEGVCALEELKHIDTEELKQSVPVMESVLNKFSKTENYRYYLKKTTILDLYVIVYSYKHEYHETLEKLSQKRIPKILITSIESSYNSIIETYMNDKEGKYTENEYGTIPAGKIVGDYPDTITLLKDEASKTVFTEKAVSIPNTRFLLRFKPDDEKSITCGRDFNCFDWSVLEAVSSLYANGNNIITPENISKLLKYNPNSRGTTRLYESLLDSLKQLSCTTITINEKGFSRSEPLLDAAFILDEEKCQIIINRPPILYEFAKFKKCLFTIPYKNKNRKTPYLPSYSSIPETIAISRFLIKYVLTEWKNPYMSSSKTSTYKDITIPIDEIYNCVPHQKKLEKHSRHSRIRNNTKNILEYYIKVQVISGYEEVMNGNTYTAYILKR